MSRGRRPAQNGRVGLIAVSGWSNLNVPGRYLGESRVGSQQARPGREGSIMSTILCRLAVASLLVAAFDVPSYADTKLKGQYSVTVLRSCIQNNAGFGIPNLENLALNGFTGTRTAEVNGILVFNGDGTGSFNNTNTTIRNQILNQNAQAISVSESQCSINYNFETDGSIRIEQSCTYITTAGRNAGEYGSVIGTVIRGRLSNNGEILFLSTFDRTNVAAISYTNPNNNTSGTDYRICNRHGTGVRISNKVN